MISAPPSKSASLMRQLLQIGFDVELPATESLSN